MLRQLLLATMAIICNNSFSQNFDYDSRSGDPVYFTEKSSLSEIMNKTAGIEAIDPGDSIEGDYVRGMCFYDNGQKLLASNFVSRNISVIDWAMQETVADIPLPGNPAYVQVFNGKAVVSLPINDTTVIIDLQTNNIIASINTPGEPNEIRIDEVNNRALVASIDSQYCYVIDLNTNSLSHTIDSFYSSLQSFSFITSNNRTDFDHYDFLVSNDGSKAMSIAFDGRGISVHDINSGTIDSTYFQISNPFAFGLSDTSRAFVLNNEATPALYRIDFNSLEMDSISLTGTSILTLCRGMAVSADGEEVILSLNGGMHKVDFVNQNFSQITSNTVFWLDQSFDHQYAVGGGFYTQIVDISTGSTTGTFTGFSQSKGAVADSGYHFVGIDPLRKEYLHSFDYSGSTVVNLADIATGSPKESDAPYRVAISNDGKTVLVSNQLSRSASIIDADSNEVVHLVSGMQTGSFGCAMTSDGKYGLIADYEGFAIHVIHIPSGQLIASPTVGDRPSIIRIAPGDTLAMVTNTRGNSISFVRLDSASSSTIATLPVGVIGVSWTNQGIFSDLQIPSVGNFALLAGSFSDNIEIINMQQQSVAATLPTGVFPTQIAFSSDGQRAVVINKNDNTISFMSVQGVFSAILNVVNTANNPTRVSYDSINDQFLVCNSGSRTVEFFDGQNGNFITSVSFGPDYTPLQAVVLKSGRPAYLLASSNSNVSHALRVDGTDYPLPARPCYMAGAKNAERIAIAMSGPDYLAIFKDDSLVINDLNNSYSSNSLKIYPNPASSEIRLDLDQEVKHLRYTITDMGGRLVKEGEIMNRDQGIKIEHLKSGKYILNLRSELKRYSGGFIKE